MIAEISIFGHIYDISMNSSVNRPDTFNNPGRGTEVRNDGFPGIKRIFALLIQYWYLFVISVPLALMAVFIYHRYTVPVYQASATLMLNSSSDKSATRSELIEGFGLSPEVRNIENQTFILRSYKIIKRTIDRLDFGVEYYSDGRFKDTELDRSAPFVVVFDSVVPQMINVSFNITSISNNDFQLSVSSEGASLYEYKSGEVKGYMGPVTETHRLKWGETFSRPYASFRIERRPNVSANSGQGYYFIFRSHDFLASQYRSRLGLSPYREGSSILFLSVSGKTPSKLTRFLNQLGEVVIENNLEQKNDIANRSIQFIQSQLQKISDTLDRTQTVLLEFRKENRFMAPATASQQLSTQYFEAEKQKKMLQLKGDYFVYLRTQLLNNPFGTDFMLPAVSDNNQQLVTQLVMELLALNNELKITMEGANGINPYIASLRRKIEITRENLLEAIDKFLENNKRDEEVINRQLWAIDSEMNDLPVLEKRYLEIERTYKLNDAIYTFLLQKNSESQITKASNAPDNEIIDQASVSGIISPNKKSNFTKALMFGLLIPAGIIALIEFLNVKVRGKDDLDQLVPDIPLMGMVPHNIGESLHVILQQSQSHIAESFRSIRTRLNFMSTVKGSRVITVTSSDTGDGKTFIAVNLASAYAVSGKKTALLGFDLRKPRLTSFFDINTQPGISNFLVGEKEMKDICYPSGQANLHIFPAGVIPPNPSELISGGATVQLFEWLRNHYDVIVVDSPPVGLVADARLLMPFADVHLYVVRFNHTRKDHLLHTIQNLKDENINHLGIVFNDFVNPSKDYGNYYSEYIGRVDE
jgi:capsular exopolysaccharide synthesis family protein